MSANKYRSKAPDVTRYLADYDRILQEGPSLTFGRRDFSVNEHVPLELWYGVAGGILKSGVLDAFRTHIERCARCQENREMYLDARRGAESERARECGEIGLRDWFHRIAALVSNVAMPRFAMALIVVVIWSATLGVFVFYLNKLERELVGQKQILFSQGRAIAEVQSGLKQVSVSRPTGTGIAQIGSKDIKIEPRFVYQIDPESGVVLERSTFAQSPRRTTVQQLRPTEQGDATASAEVSHSGTPELSGHPKQ